MLNITDLKTIFENNKDLYVDQWKELLTFPSISADPDHDSDCKDCANWLASHLEGMGLDTQILPTSSKPVVFARRNGEPGKGTVLFYGHYDVQPVDPLDEWETPPFEPTLRNERLYARGAVDNKGQILYVIKAIETLIEHNELNLTIKILIEGEEEFGSKGISNSLEKWADLVSADVLMVTDTNTVSPGIPTIIMGLRGIIGLTVTLSGPNHDLHSGSHGGIAPNPAREIAALVASLHNLDGSIAVENFCDSVIEPSENEKALVNSTPFYAENYRAKTGVPPMAGEQHLSPQERVGLRPSIDINGINSGYNGAGMKTIIPARATAKITARLTVGQDPETCLTLIVKHLEKHAPDGLQLSITDRSAAGPGFRLNPDADLVSKATKELNQLSDSPTALLWEGASIPIVSELSRVSGAELLLSGFGSEEDCAHAPNESFSITQFRLGYLYIASMLQAL